MFGIVAGLVLFSCFVWGIAIPWLRKRCARKSTKPQWTDSVVLTTRRRSRLKGIYPSHPAVRPLLSISATHSLTIYDPRTESPFPDGPAPQSTKFASTRNLRAQSTPPLSASTSSNGLFTPTKHSNIENDNSRSRFHTVPRGNDARYVPAKSFDFGDAKDFILAVPEPLALKPRDAGRPPAVARHLDRYGTSLTSLTTSPAQSDKLLHPNKLFRALQRPDVRSSFCSSTSMRIDHRRSDAVTDLSPDDVVNPVEKATNKENNTPWSEPAANCEVDKEDTMVTEDTENKGFANVHRFRSYQSLTAGDSVNRTRAGTLTRPKTPVQDLRRLFNQDQRSITLPSVHIPQHGTASALFANTEFGSDYDSLSTPATSPVIHPSNVCLLPTPLNLKKSFEPDSVEHIHASRQVNADTFASGQKSTNMIPSIVAIDDQTENSQETRGFYHTGRRLTKPLPLHIRPSSKEPHSGNLDSHRSFTDFGQAVFGPLIKSNTMRSRARASSLYSRDTNGISMVNTPVSPDFPTPASDAFTNLSVCGNPFKAPESVKARIDEWTQRIESKTVRPLPPIRHVSPFFGASPSMDEIVLEKSEDDLIERDAGEVSGQGKDVSLGEREEHDVNPVGRVEWL